MTTERNFLHVLVVDDAPEIVLVVRLILQRDISIRVTTCSAGFDSLASTTDWSKIDVALVDQRLGNFDGKELLSWLRVNQPQVRRVMFTADEKLTLEKSNAQLMLIKPVDAQTLHNAIRGIDG